jgi:hypothetical protein
MMNCSEIESKINEIENNIATASKNLSQQMEVVKDEFPSLAGDWIKRHTERKVVDCSTVSEELGIEGLTNLKSDMNDLITNLKEIVEKEWDSKTSVTLGGSEESFFRSRFRLAINHLAPVLNKYGLLVEKEGHYPDWKQKTEGKWSYQINHGFDERNVESIVTYNKILKEKSDLEKELQKVNKELSAAKAKEMWNSI